MMKNWGVSLAAALLLLNGTAWVYAGVQIEALQKGQTDLLNQVMEYRQEITVQAESPEGEKLVSLGMFKVSHYCPCVKCCGKTDGITKSGTKATAGRTIGVDPDVIPLGSTVYIDGKAYIAEDIGGGVKGKAIDMFVESHQEALERGVFETEVYVID